jgi:flavin-dependent dehydrogenase
VGRAWRLLPFPLGDVVEHECRKARLSLLARDLSFEVGRPDPMIRMTMRERLDYRLLSEAIAAGAELRAPLAVRGLSESPHAVRVATDGADFEAAFVVAADGATGKVGQMAGWGPHRVNMPACEWEVYLGDQDLEAFRDTARFDFGLVSAGYAWVFPKVDHLSVGLLRVHRGALGCQRVLADYLWRMGVCQVHRVERHGYVIPGALRNGSLVKGRVVLAGDAAGLVDPVTCEGISLAIRSGQLAAAAILEADLDPKRMARGYGRRIDTEILPELRVARYLAALLYDWPRLGHPIFRRYGRGLCEAVTGVVSGERTYRDLVTSPASYAKLLRGWAECLGTRS